MRYHEISLSLMFMHPTLVYLTDLQSLSIMKTVQRVWARRLVVAASSNQIAAGAIPRVPVPALQSTIQQYVQQTVSSLEQFWSHG